MTDTLRVLGQINPGAGTIATLYTCPAATGVTVSTLTACNVSGVDTTFNVSVAVGGAATTASQYIYYGMPLSANDTFASTVGLTLNAADAVRVYAAHGNVAFGLYGVEVT